MNPKWYETFFQGVVLDLWRAVVTPEQTRGEADFLAETLELAPEACVLDVPCGSGRHALELACRGYRVTGVDLSAESIEEARRESAARDLTVEWRLSDMRDLPWEAAFDGACCWGNSFGYLETADLRVFCSGLGRALKPGARLVIETGVAAEAILPTLERRSWGRAGDIWWLIERRYHAAESRLESIYTSIRNGAVDTRRAFYTVLTVGEIRRMLDEHGGLTTEALWSGLDRRPFELGAPDLILVARKA